MAKRITDTQLKKMVRKAIKDETAKSEFGFRLIARGIACGPRRLDRIWKQEGGPILPRGGAGRSIYAPGTEPMRGSDRRRL